MKVSVVVAATLAGMLEVSAAWSEPAIEAAQDIVEEIVVTAQRRSENLQKIPIAITAVSGEELSNAGINSSLDLGYVVPGFSGTSFGGYFMPHIRGVGTTATALGENSVATYVDGVYFASASASLLSLVDVSQIAVLKGPQGTLFGRNATGGLVQITTRDPQSTPAGELDVSFGNYQMKAADLYVTGPVASPLAADLAVHALEQPQGFGRNLATGGDVYKIDRDIAARSKWQWTPSTGSTATLSLDYVETAGNHSTTYRPLDGAASALPLLGIQVRPSGRYDTDSAVSSLNEFEGGGASLRLQQDVGFAELQSITAWRRSDYSYRFDPLAVPVPLLMFTTTQEEEQFSQEINLTSAGVSRIQWVAGLYYLDATTESSSLFSLYGPFANPFQSMISAPRLTTEAYAAYGQATIALTDADHLTLGARYSEERIENAHSGQLGVLPNGAIAGYTSPPNDGVLTSRRPTWRIALDHNFTADVMGYLSFNTGFKSGGFNQGASPTVRPERLYAYEMGLKLAVLQHRVRINSAAFYYDYKDKQVQYFDQSQIAYYNAPGAKVYGLDLDLQAVVLPGLSATVGASLLKSYFTDFSNAVTYTPQPIIGPGGVSFLTAASAKGHELPMAPSATVNLGVNYRRPLAHGIGEVDLSYFWSSSFSFAPDNAFKQDPYNMLNMSMSWSTAGEGFTATLWGKNLTDDRVMNFVTETGLVMLAQERPPRTYGVTLGTKF